MKKIVIGLMITVLCVSVVLGALSSGFSQNADEIEKAAKSVLQIAGLSVSDPDVLITGSGFIAFNSSILITNYHVIEDGGADGFLDRR